MTRRLPVVLLAWCVAGTAFPLFGADKIEERAPKQSFEVTRTERVPFLPGGTIRLENSYGYLTVEGWDEPEVEVTVTKSTDGFAEPGRKDEAERRFDQILVATERRSDKELAITTSLPLRRNLLSSFLPARRVILTLPVHGHRGVTVEYRLRVPRDSRLVVQHDNGYVWVSDVTGDIEVASHTGDMIVMLPDPGSYTVDARTGMGSVSSDLAGRGHKQFLVGTHFVHSRDAARRIRLRMGRGNITIMTGPPSAAWGKD
jgi:hypothetical protein